MLLNKYLTQLLLTIGGFPGKQQQDIYGSIILVIHFVILSLKLMIHLSKVLSSRKDSYYGKFITKTGFPLGLENLENGKAFSSQGISNRLEKSGKITQNTGELREFEINII